jgi:UPF0042 nucleotide-binding protein
MSSEDRKPHLVIVSGLSGAGKSTALNALEDMGYTSIDNLPISLISKLGQQIIANPELYRKVALGIDARSPGLESARMSEWLDDLRARGVNAQLLFLEAEDATLVRRFGKTRRPHPLAQDAGGLSLSISRERELMEPVQQCADWTINTTGINIHQLTHQVWKCIGPESAGLTLVLQSFGFTHGVPTDTDFLFDARSLPNPHWNDSLRPLTGRDTEVAGWLESEPRVVSMAGDILNFLQKWLPDIENTHRSVVTVALGCTGGRHRSVFLAEFLASQLRGQFSDVIVYHRELKP